MIPPCSAYSIYLRKQPVVNLPLFIEKDNWKTEEVDFGLRQSPENDWISKEDLEREFDVGPFGPCFHDTRYPEEWVGLWEVFGDKYEKGSTHFSLRFSLHLFEVNRQVDVGLSPISSKQELDYCKRSQREVQTPVHRCQIWTSVSWSTHIKNAAQKREAKLTRLF